MAESLTLSAPVTPPTLTEWRVVRMDLNREEQIVYLAVRSNTGARVERTERGQTALDLLIALNKANLTIKSLERRTLEYLQTKGDLPAGSVTGTPD